MNLEINKKTIDTGPIKRLIVQGEVEADTVTFKLPSEYEGVDITGLTYVLRAVSKKETMTEQALVKSVDGNFLYLIWVVTSDFTAVSGELQLELRGFDEEESIVIKFTGDPIVVTPQIGEGQVPEPSAINAAINQLQILVSNFINETLTAAEAAAEAATTAAVNPAYIGGNGNWFTFDTEKASYIDSGVSAQGPEGPEGPSGGPPGPEGPPGEDGVGVPPGGASGQVLIKASASNYDTEWSDAPETVEVVNSLTETIPGKALDSVQGKALKDIISSNLTKDNLLHNADFRIPPVNQKTQSSYTSVSNGAYNYTIDRWRQIYTGFTVAINSGYVKLSASGTNGLFNQIIENAASILPNKTWTVTIIYKNCAGTVSAGLSGQAGAVPLGDGIFTKTVTTSSGYAGTTVDISLNAGASIDIYAIKLELGSISTLANDAPADYGKQLELCRRYFERIGTAASYPSVFGMGLCSSTTAAEIAINFAPKRINGPTLSFGAASNYRLRTPSGIVTLTSIALRDASGTNDRCTLDVTVAGGLTSGQPVYLQRADGATDCRIDISADL